DANNIGLLGFSLGGCVAVLLASEMPAFKTMVLWAPVAKPAETFAYIPQQAERKQLNGRSVFDLRGYYVGERFMEALLGIRPLDAAKEITIPVLAAQGTEDKSVGLSGSSAYLEIFRKKAPGSRFYEQVKAIRTGASGSLGFYL
ncbi:dienelactone hydrolase family protein, partial [candidate division KSB1 bacterium]|nr:dienelactone hydrolase family protein [candidate division KSB1 bacterium]